MALLRGVGIPCRFHGFTVAKKLQKGIINGLFYKIAPGEIVHSWVEVFWNEQWINLEGLILDDPYFMNVAKMFINCRGSFCGYAIATNNLQNPHNEWTGGDTYIQKESIVRDFGVFNSPDEFYKKHGSNLKGFKKILYKLLIRNIINANVKKIRGRRFF